VAIIGWRTPRESDVSDASRPPPTASVNGSMGEALQRHQLHFGICVTRHIMRWLRQLLWKVRAIVLRSQVEREMEAELAAHLEAETRELTARGLDSAEARRRAANTMGHMELIKEECRDSRGTASWEHLKQDV